MYIIKAILLKIKQLFEITEIVIFYFIVFLIIFFINILFARNINTELLAYNKYCYKYHKKTDILEELNEFDVLDSFYVVCKENRCARIAEITWGDNSLWILGSSDYKTDTIHQINPNNGSLINSYQLPIPDHCWSQGLDYDSVSPGGPYFWVSIDSPFGLIYKISKEDFKIEKKYYPPDNYPEAITIYNDSLWITGRQYNILYVLDLSSEKYASIFSFKAVAYGSDISKDVDGNLFLWMIDWDYSNGKYGKNKKIHKINPYTGKIIQSYKSPSPWPFGVCWENESPGGPYLWLCDYETNKVYKLREPTSNVSKSESRSAKQTITPNPFTESTNIKFTLEKPAQATLTVYDAFGREVADLLDERLEAGERSVAFEPRGLPSGIYYCVLRAGERSETAKLVVVK